MFHPVYNWCFKTEPRSGNERPARSTGRAGARSAARARSTGSSTSAASARTTTTGRRSAMPAGATTTCCPTSASSSTTSAARTAWHGADGPLWASDIGAKHELIEALIAAGGEIGIPRNDDFNGATQEGDRLLPADDAPRPALLDGDRVPAARRARGATSASRPRRTRRGSCSTDARRPASSTARAGRDVTVTRAARGDSRRGRAAVAAAPAALGRRPARAVAASSASRSSTRSPASARTCRTICRRA